MSREEPGFRLTRRLWHWDPPAEIEGDDREAFVAQEDFRRELREPEQQLEVVGLENDGGQEVYILSEKLEGKENQVDDSEEKTIPDYKEYQNEDHYFNNNENNEYGYVCQLFLGPISDSVSLDKKYNLSVSANYSSLLRHPYFFISDEEDLKGYLENNLEKIKDSKNYEYIANIFRYDTVKLKTRLEQEQHEKYKLFSSLKKSKLMKVDNPQQVAEYFLKIKEKEEQKRDEEKEIKLIDDSGLMLIPIELKPIENCCVIS